LVIKLSADPEDWLLVHGKVVAENSSALAASLSTAWAETAKLDSIKHPITGDRVLVRTLALKQVDGTFFLEGKVHKQSTSRINMNITDTPTEPRFRAERGRGDLLPVDMERAKLA